MITLDALQPRLRQLKLSGMRWTTRGATGITTLRCQHASSARANIGAA